MDGRLAGFAVSVWGLLAFVAWRPAFHEKPPVAKTALIWIGIVSALAALSLLWALAPAMATTRAVKVIPQLIAGALMIGLMPALAKKLTPRQIMWFPLVYSAALVLIAIDVCAGLPLHRLMFAAPKTHALHVDAVNRNVMFCTLLYIPVIGLIFAPQNPHRGKRHILAGLITVLILLVLHGTGSQSAQLAFALMAVIALAFPYRARPVWALLALVIALATLSAPWLTQYLFAHLAPSLTKIPFLGEGQGFAANRLEIWDYVSRYALQKPLHGFGIDSTRAVPAFDSHQIYQRGTTILHPHNFAIQLWMEFGVIGVAVGTGFLLYIVWFLSCQTPSRARIALPVFIGGLSAAAMTYSLWDGWWVGLLFFMAALSWFTMQLYPAQPDPVTETQP